MGTISAIHDRERSFAAWANRLVYRASRHWLLLASLLWGLFAGLPWLGPVFMELGWTSAGKTIYSIYATQCHQLPQRSFFLFGPKAMYSLAEIQAVWQDTNNPLILRQFIGNAETGWKVAWSDRMSSMYGAVFVFGLAYALLRKRLKPLPWWGFALFVLPMALDGLTHLISDLAGIGQGFRDSNAWLAVLTGQAWPPTFYAGDVIGSFNSWMRLLTGVLFGMGLVWFAYPYLEEWFAEARRDIGAKFERAGLQL
jgi:uncharacterized membrane protein